MRKIDSVIIHCSATKAGMDFSVADIDRWHRAQGMNGIGYHYVVRLDGTVEKGREVEVAGAHCLGWNGRSIGICYIGGLDTNGNPADTRTDEQKKSMKACGRVEVAVSDCDGDGAPGYFAGFEWEWDYRTG